MEAAVLENKPKKKRYSREGCCSADGCNSPIKAKRLCEKHYARQLRYGTLELKSVRVDKEKLTSCLVFDCENPAGRRGYCDRHYSYWQKHKTPFRAKVFKVCAVEDCNNEFYTKGLCSHHYNQFKQKLKTIGIEDF